MRIGLARFLNAIGAFLLTFLIYIDCVSFQQKNRNDEDRFRLHIDYMFFIGLFRIDFFYYILIFNCFFCS